MDVGGGISKPGEADNSVPFPDPPRQLCICVYDSQCRSVVFIDNYIVGSSAQGFTYEAGYYC